MVDRSRRPDARPDEILDAALNVFAAQGFDRARMEDIAAQAGLSKAGIYLYFTSKSELLRALIARTVAPVAQRAAALAHHGVADPVATLRAVVAMAAAALDDPGVIAVPRLVISAANSFPDVVDAYRAEVVDPMRRALRLLVESGVAKGVFAPIDPDEAVRLFMGPILFEALRRHVLRDTEAPRLTDWIGAHIVLVLSSLASRSPQ
jgi:AcrR family transcriptional regulator